MLLWIKKKKKQLGFAKDFEDSVYKCQGKCHIYRKKKKKALQNTVVENFAVYKNDLRVFIMSCRSFVDVFMTCTRRP